MSDRPGHDIPDESMKDEELDYLDAAVSENFDTEGEPPLPVEPLDEDIASEPERLSHDAPTEPVDTVEATAPIAVPPSAEPVAPAEPAVPARPRDTSWSWPLISLAGWLAVLGVSWAANAWTFNDHTTAGVLDWFPVPFRPADWFFGLWVVVMGLVGLFVVWGILPAGRHNDRLQRVSPAFLVSNIAAILWILFWHWEQFSAAFVSILVALVAVFGVFLGVRFHNPFRRRAEVVKPPLFERLTMRLPFSVYLGWTIFMTLVTLMVWWRDGRWDGGPISFRLWAVVFMAVATLVSAVFVFSSRAGLMPLVMGIGFVAIANQAWGGSALVAVAAIVFTVVCAGLAFVAWVLASEVNIDRTPFGRKSAGEPLPPSTPIE